MNYNDYREKSIKVNQILKFWNDYTQQVSTFGMRETQNISSNITKDWRKFKSHTKAQFPSK